MTDPYLYPAAEFCVPHPNDATFVADLVAGLASAGARVAAVTRPDEVLVPLIGVPDNILREESK